MAINPKEFAASKAFGLRDRVLGPAIQQTAEMLEALARRLASLRLSEISDVSMATAPTNGQALVYDAATGLWKPATVGGGGGAGEYFGYYHSANYSITSSPFTTPFETVIRDDVGEYDTTSGELTPATSGPYILHLTLFDSQACAAGQWLTGEWVKTSSGGAHVGWFGSNADSQPANKFFTGSLVCYLEAGETYAPQIYGPGHLLAGGSDKMVLAGIKL